MVTIQGRGAGRRLSTFKDRFIIDSWRGVTRIRKWPKKQKKIPNLGQQQQRTRFREAIEAAKRMDADQQQMAREASAHTQYLPRDFLVQLLYGRAFYFILPDGRKIFSMASRNDTSLLLDTISQEPGAILVRGDEWWTFLPPGPEGYVLTSIGDGNIPQWAPPSGGEGGFAFAGGMLLDDMSFSTESYATAGMMIEPRESVSITRATWLMGSILSSYEVRFRIFRISDFTTGAELLDLVYDHPEYSGGGSSVKPWHADFTEAVTLVAGEKYAVFVTRVGQTVTSSLNMAKTLGTSDFWLLNGPIDVHQDAAYIATFNPTVGDTIDAVVADTMIISLSGAPLAE